MGDAKSTTRPNRTTSEPTVGASADVPDEEAASRLGLAVLRLARRLRQQTPPGITPTQLSALSIVGHAGPIAMTDLAAVENVQPPTMSRIVAALEEGGWVEREADRTDRRVTLVRATPKAKRELARVRAERNDHLSRHLDAVGADDRAVILAAIPALERLLQNDEP